MTGPGAGGEPGTEPYEGPPPMRRPEPGQWQPAAWPPGLVAWVPPPWQAPPAPPPPPPPAAVRWAPPPGTPPHDVPQPYLLAMRSRDWAWWRPLLGLLLFAVVWFVLDVVATVAGLLGLLVAGTDVGALPDLALDQFADPWFLLLLNVSLIVAIPCVWMVWAVAHGMRIGWSSSVLGRLRRRLLLPFTRLALATLGAGIGLSVLLGFVLGGEEVTGPVPSFGWLLAVVILTTPLQSAAEEYFFRGYLSQAIAGWVRHPRAGALAAAVVSAALFSAAHVPPDVPTFLDRFAFGLAASAVVWLTGGLEAAVVLHAVNNVLVFVLAGALGEGVVTEDVPAGTGILFLLLTLLATAAYVALVARSRGRLRPETHTEARDLRMPGPPVPAPAG
jgi:membrane protease YdiL (CAAX protease family)